MEANLKVSWEQELNKYIFLNINILTDHGGLKPNIHTVHTPSTSDVWPPIHHLMPAVHEKTENTLKRLEYLGTHLDWAKTSMVTICSTKTEKYD